MIWLLAHPLPPLSRKQARPATHRKTVKARHLVGETGGGGRGMGEEPNHTTARKLGVQ
jgi:hypothetical protein